MKIKRFLTPAIALVSIFGFISFNGIDAVSESETSVITSVAPPSIGDFLWYDSNHNGIQDPGEPGLNGVNVQIYREVTPGNFVVVGADITDVDGVYVFDNTNSTPFLDNTLYYIVVEDPIMEPGSMNPTGPTLQDAGPISPTQDDLDSDASIAAGGFPFDGKPYIEYTTTTGFAAINNLDFGFFTLCSELDVSIDLVDEICEGETVRLNVLVDGGVEPYGFDWSDGHSSSDPFYDVSPSSNTTYVVTVTDDIGCTATSSVDTRVRRCTLDMALIKTIPNDPTFKVGDIATFTITVCNQGETVVDSIVIQDHIPNGYTLVDPDWTIVSSSSTYFDANYTMTITNGELAPDGLLPGVCMDIPIDLEIVTGANPSNLVNYAEIEAQRDIFGFEDDFDSNPGSNTAEELSVMPGDPNDDNLTTGGPSEFEDEDDHDPAQAPFFDLALSKTIGAGGPFKYGDVLTFDINIYNQGNVPATDIVVLDYVPSGLRFIDSNAPLWSYDGSSGNASSMVTGILNPGETMTIPLVLEVISTDDQDGWLNIAEIFAAEDDNGIDRTDDDVDSQYDGDSTNDIGGTPETDEDDHIDDDGMDSDGDGITDEDDHDPELIKVFDLALKKELITDPPYSYGQDLIFEITVCNQGNTVAKDIEITDYVPDGLEYNPLANGFLGWTGASPNPTNVNMTQLAPGDCQTETIILRMVQADDPLAWNNYAEITRAFDNDLVDMTNNDADSTPGSNTAEENAVVPGSEDDDNMDGGGPSVGEDEDDHDPAGPMFYDLALDKKTNATGPFRYGDEATFTITVHNQGNLPVTDISIIDYIPSGFSFDSNNFPTWVFDSQNNQATSVINFIEAGGEASVDIDLIFVATTDPEEAWTNYAEILQFKDTDGIDVSDQDIDSTPDGDNTNDVGGTPETDEDDHIDDDGLDSDGDGITDEDDHDPAKLEVFDLALKKEIVSLPPYNYGDMFVYEITVYNQGNIPATNIQLRDYLPAGLGFDLGNNPGWNADGTYDIGVVINPGESHVVTLNLLFNQTSGGAEDWLNYVEIVSAMDDEGNDMTNNDADSQANSNSPEELAVLPGSEDDNNIDGGGPSVGEDEDDHDPAGIYFADVALTKSTDESVPFKLGDLVNYTVTIRNQGNIELPQVGIIDHIPSGLYLTDNNFPLWSTNSQLTTAETVVFNLMPGEVREIPLTFQLRKADAQMDGWDNYAEVSFIRDGDNNDIADIDSTPDENPNNDIGGTIGTDEDDHYEDDGNDTNGDGITDEDDHDPERIEIFDLALRKVMNTAMPISYGDMVEFEIEIYNQGNEPATNIVISDYIPNGYLFDVGNNAGWVANASGAEYTIAGPLMPESSTSILLNLEVVQTNGGEKDWINYAEIMSAENSLGADRSNSDFDSDYDSNSEYEQSVEPNDLFDDEITGCGEDNDEDEDDHDPAGFEIVDAALSKVTSQTGPFMAGDVVNYTITVYNQGSTTIDDIGIVDHIPSGLEFMFSNFPTWFANPTGNIAVTRITNLEPGEERTVSISLQVAKSSDGSLSWDNHAEIYYLRDGSQNEFIDIDSQQDFVLGNDIGGTPETDEDNHVDDDGNDTNGDGITDEDDHDPERIEIFDLALIKEVDMSQDYEYGDIIQFDITVYNQGNEPATDIVISDYIPVGYEFISAANLGWTAVAGGAEYTIDGPLMPDANITIPIMLRLVQTSGGERDWINYAEIKSASNSLGQDRTDNDIDSTPASNSDYENEVVPGHEFDNVIGGCGESQAEDEDDHDPAGIMIQDLALRKSPVEPGPYDFFDIVTYEIEVCNQGNKAARNIDVIDYLPVGLNYVMDNFPTWNYNDFDKEAVTRIMGPLMPGQCESVEIMLEIQKLKDDEDAWDNRAEIYGAKDIDFLLFDDIDSEADDIVGNDVGGTPWTNEDDHVDDDRVDTNNDGIFDEDDEDVARIEMFDLALKKQLDTPEPYEYNQVVEFGIWIHNQGNEEANDIELIDYLPPGYSFNAGINPGWSQTAQNLHYTYAGPLPAVDSVRIPLFLEIIRTDGGDKFWINYTEILHANGRASIGKPNRDDWDVDSTPGSNSEWETNVEIEPYNTPTQEEFPWDDEICGCGPEYDEDEDDHDPAGIEIFDLAQRKTTNAVPPTRYGDVIAFNVEIYNQGSLDAHNIEVTEYVPCGFEFLDAQNSDWTYDESTRKATLLIPELLAAGSSVTKVINLMAVPCIEESLIAWTNYTEISDAETEILFEPNDFDSSPNDINDDTQVIDNMLQNPNDEDDHDLEKIDVLDLALRKTTPDCGPFAIGDTVHFDITVFNQGNIVARNIEVVDSLNTGFIFDQDLNPDWNVVGDKAYFNIPTDLIPMDSVKIAIEFIITMDENPFASDWWNYAEIASATNVNGSINVDADSNADDLIYNDNYVEPTDPINNIIDENDDVIDENWPVYGDVDEGNDDEDDSDPAKVLVLGGLGDTVWKDLDGDGLQDENEPGLARVDVFLYNCSDSLIDQQTTNVDGFYFFDNLIQGQYKLKFDLSQQPLGCDFTYKDVGDDDAIDSDVFRSGYTECIDVMAGVYDSTWDAGVLILATVGDFVWHDLNGNGLQDGSEPGLEGVKVYLFDENDSLIQGTISDEFGFYEFKYVYPGNYYLYYDAPEPYELTFDNEGFNDEIDSDPDKETYKTEIFNLSPGEVDNSWDAGFYKCIPIGELVWYDVNEDDLVDATENGINGLKVNLWKYHKNEWIIWETQYTDHKPNTPSVDGYFEFCSPPGTYYVEVILPPYGLVPAVKDVLGYIPLTNSNEQANDNDMDRFGRSDQFTVQSCDAILTMAAGYYPMATVGNLVWMDTNSNGAQDFGEPRMGDVKVEVFNASNELIAETHTADDGTYSLEYLQKSNYYLKFTMPSGYGPTIPNMGNDNEDSDVDNSNGYGTTKLYSFMPGDELMSVDAGLAFGVLPVTWLDIDAVRVDESNVVTWRVKDEVNVEYYEVERMLNDGKSFIPLDKVPYKQSNTEIKNYSYIDLDARENGIYTYRVAQYDYNGDKSYSDMVSIRVLADNEVSLSTNPAVDRTELILSLEDGQDLQAHIYDIKGRLIKKNVIDQYLESGQHNLDINISDLVVGSYIIRVMIDDVVIEKQLIKIR